MSYYHYFKLKKDSKYQNWEPKKKQESFIKDTSKNEFYVKMIQAYYNTDSTSKVRDISFAVQMYIWKDLYDADENYLNQMYEDENHELWRNRPMDDYDMQSCVDEWNDYLDRVVKRLTILSTVRFVSDDRYSDTPKTEMEYLQYEYIDKIDEELSLLEEYTLDYTFAKFVLNHCIRRTEDQETYPDEEIDNESSEDNGNS